MPVFRKLPVLVDAIRLRREKVIKTLEGTMTGNPGDWLITGVNGEQYPCKHDIFIQTYEPEGADKCQFCRDAEKCSGNRDGCVFHWKW